VFNLIAATFIFLSSVSGALAVLGDIVNSFDTPEPIAATGLARSDNFLYYLDAGEYSRVFITNPANGSIFNSWYAPHPDNTMRGLAYTDDGSIWIGWSGDDCVYRCNAQTGSVISSWYAGNDARGLAPFCTGDGGKNTTAIITSDDSPSYCWFHNLNTGSVLSSFPVLNVNVYDIAWDFRNGLVWKGSYPSYVFGYRNSWVAVASFTIPGGYTPMAIAYYGEYLWVACGGNKTTYQIHCPAGVAVAPASLGRVKALFQ